MPSVRKLAHEEVQALENKGKGTRKRTEEQYDTLLCEYAVGDYGEATLDADEKRLTVRNRLKAAATRRALGIAFRRTPNNSDTLRFQIVAASTGNGSAAPVVVHEAPPELPAKRKGGRPKKTA
jgi:hypothetical protein